MTRPELKPDKVKQRTGRWAKAPDGRLNFVRTRKPACAGEAPPWPVLKAGWAWADEAPSSAVAVEESLPAE